MGKMTNVSWVVYGQDIDQPKLVILINLFFFSAYNYIEVGINNLVELRCAKVQLGRSLNCNGSIYPLWK